ncbi:hypothetical protein BLOT_010418 [Blomia tropicalis]|nr:hypothetical protein BLOT_010418 [Blomia tropicalis]
MYVSLHVTQLLIMMEDLEIEQTEKRNHYDVKTWMSNQPFQYLYLVAFICANTQEINYQLILGSYQIEKKEECNVKLVSEHLE